MNPRAADPLDLAKLAATLRASRSIAAKADIGLVAGRLGLSGTPARPGDGSQIAGAVPVGDDCAAIPDGDGYLLLAIEGFINEFVASDPWFAGWCSVMVNISDVAAMGGRATAVVDAIWAQGEENAAEILAGMRAASVAYGVPIVGGHSNLATDRSQLSVAILGRAKQLLTSFDARPGDRLVMAVDLRGRYRAPYANWEAATDAPPTRLRGDLDLLPEISEAGLSRAAKDISQGGVIGTAAMLAECSGVGMTIDVTAVPMPDGVALDRWLLTFPSFGYLISAAPGDVSEIIALFAARGIAAADIGAVEAGHRVSITDGRTSELIRDLAVAPLILGEIRLGEIQELVA